MTVLVSVELNLNKFIPNIKRKFDRDIKAIAVDEVRASIQSGISPVKGRRTFKKYSSRYAKVKGRELPVDMEVTGKMLATLRAKVRRAGRVRLTFNSRIADFHNRGAGTLPIRRLLPTKRGEEFKLDIMNNIVKRTRGIVRAETRKQNR